MSKIYCFDTFKDLPMASMFFFLHYLIKQKETKPMMAVLRQEFI